MEEASFMEHVRTAPSDDKLFQNPLNDHDDDDDDDDDESFVPDSLRAFMEDANAKLDADLSDILNSDNRKNKTSSAGNNNNNNHHHWMEDDDDTDMDEDPPAPQMPDMDHVNSLLASTISSSSSLTTATATRSQSDGIQIKNSNNNNNSSSISSNRKLMVPPLQQQQQQQYEEPPEEEEEDEEPILSRLQHIIKDVDPPTTMQDEEEDAPAAKTKAQDKPFAQLTTRDLLQPKPIPDPNALDDCNDDTETDENSNYVSDNQFFKDILKQEEDLSLKHNLMMGLLDEDAAREKQFKEEQRRKLEKEEYKERERLRKLQLQQEQHYYDADHNANDDSSVPTLESINAPIANKAKDKSSFAPSPDRILESKVFEDDYYYDNHNDDDDDEDDVMLEELLAGNTNPAAHLTVMQAKDMLGGDDNNEVYDNDDDDDLPALENEDALPKRDLAAELLKAEQEFGTPSSPALVDNNNGNSDSNSNNQGVPKNNNNNHHRPSPSKKPKLDAMDAMLLLGNDTSSDYDQIESEMDRSYISSSSEEGDTANKPQSPPSIVHQTDTPPSLHELKQTLQQPENRVPTLAPNLHQEQDDLLQEALEVQKKAEQLTKSPLRAPPKPEVVLVAQAKAAKARKPTKKPDASSELLGFLHPSIKNDKEETSRIATNNNNKKNKGSYKSEIIRPRAMMDPKVVDNREAIAHQSTPAKKRDGTPPKPPKTPDRPMVLTPPSMSQQQQMKQQASDATPPSPAGAVDNIFDYLHPTNDNKTQAKANRNRNTSISNQPVQRKQLFSGPPTEAKPPKATQPANHGDQQPAMEVTIPSKTASTIITSPSMSRTNQSQAFSPTSSIGFGSPTSELRKRRQMMQEQYQQQYQQQQQQQQQSEVPNSPMSMASTIMRRQGHSPLVNRKHPPKELTSPDKNISSRLLRGTAATRAGTRVKYGQTIQQQQQQQPKPRTRRNTPMMAGSSIKGMAETRIGSKSSTAEQADPPVATSATNKTTSAVADPKATRARVRDRMGASRRGTTQSNREKKAEQKRNIKSTMDRVRERKERMAKMEQERVAKLKAKIAEREKKTQERKAKLEAERASPQKIAASKTKKRSTKTSIPPRPITVPKTPNFMKDKRPKPRERKEERVSLANADSLLMRSFREDQSMGSTTGERKLTIPKGPSFQTDKRLKPVERREERVSLANADTLLMRSFRDDQSMGGGSSVGGERKPTIPIGPSFQTDKRLKPVERREERVSLANADTLLMRSFRDDQSMGGGSTSGARKITIPKTPNLVTKKKYGDRSSAKRGDDDEGSVHHWQDGLRTATSPSKSVCSQLTIPQTPNFQPERKRQPAVSTAEREQAEMDYYKANPFKARPVGSGVKSFSSTATKQVEKRKLTAPKPFRLSVGKQTSPDHRDQSKPKTLFPAPRGTPADGFKMRKKRSTTTPKPFQLSSSRQQSFSPTESADSSAPPQQIDVKATKKFHARPMPSFDTPSIPVRDKDPSKLRSPPPKSPEEVKPFKARGVPKSLSKPSIPVRRRDPSKLRSPDYVKTSPEYLSRKRGKVQGGITSPDSSESKAFRARRAPFRSPPDIPVRGKDPRKLRPVPSKKQTVPAPPSLAGSSYGSNASSLESRVDKRKAIRENLRQRMKGRRGKSESVTTTDSSVVGVSMDTTVTTSIDGATTSYEAPGVSTYYNILTDSSRADNKIGKTVPAADAVSPNAEREKLLLQAAMKKGADAVSPNAKREKSLLQAAMKKGGQSKKEELRNAMSGWSNDETPMASAPSAESEASTPITKGGQSKKEELRSAMGGWMFDSVPATVTAGLAVKKPPADRISEIRRKEPDPLEAARIAEAKRKREELLRLQNRSKTYEETTEMALQLQQQLEDALSFEATYSAGDDLDQGYIGQPAGSLGHFDL
ncbi:unnamed protein product [Cylindrotheca closterium]|uniref:Uncharacterized protein n=1 Tax=Cylindrotheca closterium TaxID=2856 RepID=A0AAD2FFZ5_9STRA|nr:unnamed protein product [Cylindrotheca closterium]